VARRAAGPGWSWRLGIAARTLAAVGGGYALAALATLVLATGLPLARTDAVLLATMLSFVVMTGAVVWAFAARSAAWAWAGLLPPAALLGLLWALQEGLSP